MVRHWPQSPRRSAYRRTGCWSLSTHRGAAAEILDQAVQVAETERHPVDEHLLAWYRDAVGAKVRHVPANLPDVLKTEAVLAYEYAGETLRTADQAITGTRDQRALLGRAETDMEIALSKEALEGFARGEGLWTDLPAEMRREQLEAMGRSLSDLYPSLRLHLFAANDRYSAPFTVFGQKWAALYLGQRYLAFSNTRHVQLFSSHFDDLVRHAVVRSHEGRARLQRLWRGASEAFLLLTTGFSTGLAPNISLCA